MILVPSVLKTPEKTKPGSPFQIILKKFAEEEYNNMMEMRPHINSNRAQGC